MFAVRKHKICPLFTPNQLYNTPYFFLYDFHSYGLKWTEALFLSFYLQRSFLKRQKAFFFIYFGLVFLLLQKSGSAQWMQTSAYSLIFQVSVLEIFLFLFLMIETDRAKGLDKKGGEKKKRRKDSLLGRFLCIKVGLGSSFTPLSRSNVAFIQNKTNKWRGPQRQGERRVGLQASFA